MSQCSSELQMNMQDLQLQTLISRVAQLESKLDTHLAAQAACNQSASDNTTSTAICCETSQATIWKPTPLIAMFELMNTKMLQLESLVASTATLGAVIDDTSNNKLQNNDCLTQLESQFNERMANMQTLLEMATPHTTTERNNSSIIGSEQNSAVSPTDPLQTLITIVSHEPENFPVDKCELLKCCLDNMAVSTSGSTTTTVLTKHDELAELVGILADSSISAERYTRLELLVDLIAESSGKIDKHMEDLKTQVKANADELKLIISKEKELDDKCATFQTLTTEKTKKKNSKTQPVFDTQLVVLNAMSNECKAYKTNLHELSIAIIRELREDLFQIINIYLRTEFELQLSKNKLNNAAADNSLSQQSLVSVPEPTVVSNLPKITCTIVGSICTGKSTLRKRLIPESVFSHNNMQFTIIKTSHSTDFTVDGVRYNLNVLEAGGYEDNLQKLRQSCYKDADVVLICFCFYKKCSITQQIDEVTTKWIPEVRKHCPKTPIVLVNTSITEWKSTDESKSTFDFKDGMRLAQQITADTYVEYPYKPKERTFNQEDTDAVFVAAVRAAVKAITSQSALDRFKSFLAGRRTNIL